MTIQQKPIIFKPEMVKAILGGHKTQTRRVLKKQPPSDQDFKGYVIESSYSKHSNTFRFGNAASDSFIKPPYYNDDLLWVRENFAVDCSLDFQKPSSISIGHPVYYPATNQIGNGWITEIGKIRPSIFMPKWASRLTLIVHSIKVQRLQDISENDACCEGIELVEHNCYRNYLAGTKLDEKNGAHYLNDPIGSFKSLWISINGRESWEANPWVWVTDFIPRRTNVSQLIPDPDFDDNLPF